MAQKIPILPLFFSIGNKLPIGQQYEWERLRMGCFPSLFLPSFFTVKEWVELIYELHILMNLDLGKKRI